MIPIGTEGERERDRWNGYTLRCVSWSLFFVPFRCDVSAVREVF